TTYLETEGTRCNYEGRVLAYARAVEPPAGVPGWQLLVGLARACGVEIAADSAEDLTCDIALAARRLDGTMAFYWNTGEERKWPGPGRLVPVPADTRPAPAEPPVTHTERYKQGIQTIGTERFRVV
ncbi:MAG: hypothetical protein JXB04_13530, partial [Kiritimatiellae bacterium]|nr:hypothetical protein [Kiritimatiellia bacterium]